MRGAIPRRRMINSPPVRELWNNSEEFTSEERLRTGPLVSSVAEGNSTFPWIEIQDVEGWNLIAEKPRGINSIVKNTGGE